MVISFYELYIFPINIIVIMGSVCIYIYPFIFVILHSVAI